MTFLNARVMAAVVAGMLASSSCSNAYDSKVLMVHWEPPSGVKLAKEAPGAPAVATFSEGVEVRVAEGALPDIDDKSLDAVLAAAVEKAHLSTDGMTVTSSRAGSIRMGPVARYEGKGPRGRALVYVVPDGARFIVLMLGTPLDTDGKLEARFEQSLASLKPRR